MPSAHRDEALTVNARVVEALPNALFRVEIETEKRGQATVHASGAAALTRLHPGDPVVVELMPYDMTRGRIVKRRT